MNNLFIILLQLILQSPLAGDSAATKYTICNGNPVIPPFTGNSCGSTPETEDHTNGNGNYFFYGDAPSEDCSTCAATCTTTNAICTTIAWQQNIAISTNTTHNFSMWYKKIGSLTSSNHATLSVFINNILQATVCANSCDWTNLCFSWKSGNNVSNANIQIKCKGDPFFYGNDFGLDDIEFGPEKPTQAIFSFTNELCNGNNFSFNTTGSSSGIDYAPTWDFGDGTGVQGGLPLNPTHQFLQPGQYVVTLTITHLPSGCCAKYSALVSVTPSSNNPSQLYNPNCCSNNVLYNWNGSFTIDGTPSHTSSTFLNPSSPNNITGCIAPSCIAIRDTLRIKNNQNVSFSNMSIYFGPWGKLIIEPGSQLTLTNVTLRGVGNLNTQCPNAVGYALNMMWQGIEVWGDPSFPQNTTAPQGRLVLKGVSGATIIQDAHNAVVLGKFCDKALSFSCNAPTPKTCYPYDLAYSGGFLDASTGVIFRNNANNIRVAPYYPLEQSKVIGCTFQGGLLLDPGYSSSNTNYKYPNQYNKYYPSANAFTTTKGRTNSFAHLWGVRNFVFADNTFDNSQKGIEIYNSSCKIVKNTNANGNTFQNIIAPIDANYINTTFFGNLITENIFQNLQGITPTIQIHGGLFDFIKLNTLNAGNNPPSAFMGIWMDNSSAFKIMNNTFQNYTYGTAVGLSYSGGGTIANDLPYPKSLGNIFSTCSTSVYTYSKNFNLQIKCNDFRNGNNSIYKTNWDINSTLANQGSNTSPAGNKFDRLHTPPLKDIKSSSSGFDYWRHTFTIFPVAPGNNACLIPIVSGPITIKPSTTITEPMSLCDPLPPCNPCTRVADLDNQLIQLQNEFSNTLAGLDKGQTTQLLSAINQNTPDGTLKTQLLAAGFLSDLVLTAFINRSQSTAPGIFKDVIVANSPVSNDVNLLLSLKLNSLPSGIAGQIRDAQANQSNRTLTAIMNDILYTQQQRQLALNDQITQYITNDDIFSAVSMLNAEHTAFADQQLFSYYLGSGDLISAAAKLTGMTVSTPEDQQFITLAGLLLTIAQDGRTVFDLSASEIVQIRNIAQITPNSLAAANAQAILKLVFNEDYQFSTATATMRGGENNSSVNYLQEQIEENFLGDNFPYPFSGQTAIPYLLLGGKGEIKIYDVAGRLMQQVAIKEGENILLLNTEQWKAGVYYYTMETERKIISTKKMILIK